MKSRRSKIIASSGFLLVIAVSVWLLGLWMSGPVSVTPESSSVLGETVSTSQELKELNGKLFSTSMPGDFTVKTQNLNAEGVHLEQILAVGQRGYAGARLAVTVGIVPKEGLTSISDIQFRKSNPDIYESVSRPELPEAALVFENTKSYDISVFWSEDGKYSSIVLAGLPEKQETLDKDIVKIVNDWRWK